MIDTWLSRGSRSVINRSLCCKSFVRWHALITVLWANMHGTMVHITWSPTYICPFLDKGTIKPVFGTVWDEAWIDINWIQVLAAGVPQNRIYKLIGMVRIKCVCENDPYLGNPMTTRFQTDIHDVLKVYSSFHKSLGHRRVLEPILAHSDHFVHFWRIEHEGALLKSVSFLITVPLKLVYRLVFD